MTTNKPKKGWQLELQQNVQNAFGPQGWLVKNKFKYLPAQAAYADAVTQWLLGKSDQPIGFLEGETGTGKTLGYLIPLLLYAGLSGHRVGVSTFSIFLQQQILARGGDMARAQAYGKHCGLPHVAVGQYLGKQCYVDPQRVELRIAELKDEGRGEDEHKQFAKWAHKSSTTGSGLTRDWIESFGPLPNGISEEDVGCQNHETPALQTARQLVHNAQLVLTSHTALIWDSIKRGKMLSDDGENLGLSAVVIDEGDQLEVAAERVLEQRIQPRHVAKLCEEIGRHYSGPDKGKATRAANRYVALNDAMQTLSDRGKSVLLWQQLPKNEQQDLRDLLMDCRESTRHVLSLRSKGIAESYELECVLPVVERLLDSTNERSSWQFTGLSWSPVRRYPSLVVQTQDPLRVVSYGWSKESSERPKLLLTSATLSGRTGLPDFKEIRRKMRLSADAVAIEGQFAPDVFGSMNFVLPDAAMPSIYAKDDGEWCDGVKPMNTAWIAATARMITDAMTRGRTLVICVSYRETEALAKLLDPNAIVLHQAGYSLQESTQLFCNGTGRALLSPACWEGVSLRLLADGMQAFDQCVITRIPFPPPNPGDDLLAQHMVDNSDSLTLSSAKIILDGMMMQRVRRRLRQGIGRGIRHASDKVTVWIADPRFPRPEKKSTLKNFVHAIPARFLANYRNATVWQSNSQSPPKPARRRYFA